MFMEGLLDGDGDGDGGGDGFGPIVARARLVVCSPRRAARIGGKDSPWNRCAREKKKRIGLKKVAIHGIMG
jgi:hypothetical protein